MKTHNPLVLLTVFVAGCGLFGALTTAHASYIDPGSGSYLFQLAIAGLLGAGVALRGLWGKLPGTLRRFFRRER